MNNEVGKLSATCTNSAGKKVDEWVFRSPFGNVYKCVVKILATSREMVFEAYALKDGESAQGRLTTYNTQIFDPIRDTDINKLKLKVEEAFRLFDGVQNGANWSNWYEIVIAKTDSVYAGHGRADLAKELSIAYRVMKKGTLPDGTEVYVDNNNKVKVFPLAKAQGDSDPDADRFNARKTDSEYAYVPATPENLTQIEAMIDGLNTLHVKISEFVRLSNGTGKIESSLFNLIKQLK